MKLNTKQTVLVGFAFLAISAFWQMYDNLVPLILTNTFDINKTFSGAIMAADNVLALFLLPIFGTISDKSKNPLGRRRPFILRGTIVAVILMMGLPILDNSYAANPAPVKAIAFIAILGILLITMGTFRSPAVALMPDITPKPLRSKANAIINLMGAIGGIIYLVLTTIISPKSSDGSHVNVLPLFAIVAGIMLISLFIIMFFVNEPKLVRQQLAYEAAHPEQNLTKTTENKKEYMPPAVRRSLIFMLLSVALWFIGYNGITTWFSVYAQQVWNMKLGDATLCLTVATAGAIASYIPVGIIASHIGRRRTIKFGAALLSSCFFVAFIYTLLSDKFSPLLLILFVLVGVAWASINVNSLPMVVEMCKGSDVGKFTGLYYTFSMTAQIVTPIVAGWLLENVGYKTLFPYSAVFVALSYVTMCFVRHGDNKIEAKVGIEAFDIDD
ncbi:MAG: MFS transporter [Clostridia bacterium]|nr:MFS transporter [Clostridia bacterium]